MSKSIPTPLSAEHEDPQFMDHYGTMSVSLQHIVIVIMFLAILAGIVILKDMLKTSEKSQHHQG